ncbi:MAG: ThuA domain-containing protein [Gammaproteobacteria bacterium]|nr:ThuA domain-containing protein [Gammaproteobacteria bacterium]
MGRLFWLLLVAATFAGGCSNGKRAVSDTVPSDDPPFADETPPGECLDAVLPAVKDPLDVLLFSRTVGFRHASIERAVDELNARGPTENLTFTHTEDPSNFTTEYLSPFDVVVWLNTTGDVLDDSQQAAFEEYIRSGKGYVGVHSATDTEDGWPWYGDLAGAYFQSHPAISEVVVTTEDRCHPSTSHLDSVWTITEEIYSFDRDPRVTNQILLTIDGDALAHPGIGRNHPIAWFKEFDGGRSFYTNLGHQDATWLDDRFMTHLVNGIRWAAGPIQSSLVVVTSDLLNPRAMDLARDGRVFITECSGEVVVWSPASGRVETAPSQFSSQPACGGGGRASGGADPSKSLDGPSVAPWMELRRTVDFEIAGDGALYVLEAGTGFGDAEGDARLIRIEFSAAGALSPVAEVQARPRNGSAPLVVTFSSAGSRAPGANDTIARYEWDFDGDGVVDATDPTATFRYDTNDVYQPTLVVVGSSGRRSLPKAMPIVVGNSQPEVRIIAPVNDTIVTLGATVRLEGAVMDAEDGEVSCELWQWHVGLGHGANFEGYQTLDGCATEFSATRLDVDEASHLVVELVYRDVGGFAGEPSLAGRDRVGLEIE